MRKHAIVLFSFMLVLALSFSFLGSQAASLAISPREMLKKIDITAAERLFGEKEAAVLHLLAALKGGKLDESKFSTQDIAHMEDVKSLVKTGLLLRWAALGLLVFSLFLYMFLKKRGLHVTMLKGIGAGMLTASFFYVICCVFGFLSFEKVFDGFHAVLFSNTLWRMDKAHDSLIRLFPQKAFIAYAKTFAYNTGFFHLGMLLGAVVLLKKIAKEDIK